mmetsp:Transcript_41381/g.89701  ORF Transcript_41381/g.89701 Transcript_41381/m.89701 type:complete len:302 (-) Transcript_41381:6-911(-)
MSALSAQSILEAACKELACQPKEFIQSGKEDSHPQPDNPEPALRKRQAEALGANSAAELLDLHFPGMERPSCLRLAEKCPTKSKKARPGGNLQQGEMLWGSGLVLAAWMCLEQIKSGLFRDKRVLELGSGLGTAGLVAATLGAAEVVLSDRSGPVLESLQGNMHLNPDSRCLQCIPLDWSSVQERGGEVKDFDTVIGSDILYDSGLFPSLLSTLDHVLMPGGHFFAVDPGRLGCSGGPAFADLIVKERPAWEIHLETLEEATKFADEHLPDVEIFLPEQRRHGLAVALGSCTQVEILPYGG